MNTLPPAMPSVPEGYRAQAARALLWLVAISGLAFSTGLVAIWASVRPLRHIAASVVHACLQLWVALPVILQWMLGLSAAAALLSAVLWLASLSKQWWTTGRSIATLLRQTVQVPERLHSLVAKLGLTSRVIAVESLQPVALTVGLIVPRIIISTGLVNSLNDEELEAVLLHEQTHLQHRDPLRLLAARSLATAFFYVPAVRVLARRHLAAVELAADEYAIVRQGHSLGLSSAMLRVLQTAPVEADANRFTGSLDLRLTHLLTGEARLPAISARLGIQSIVAAVALAVPAFATPVLAVALSHASFLLRCAV